MHHVIGWLVLLVIGYCLFHIGHSHAIYRANRHRGFLSRIWVSIPGPFNTRISRRL